MTDLGKRGFDAVDTVNVVDNLRLTGLAEISGSLAADKLWNAYGCYILYVIKAIKAGNALIKMMGFAKNGENHSETM